MVFLVLLLTGLKNTYLLQRLKKTHYKYPSGTTENYLVVNKNGVKLYVEDEAEIIVEVDGSAMKIKATSSTKNERIYITRYGDDTYYDGRTGNLGLCLDYSPIFTHFFPANGIWQNLVYDSRAPIPEDIYLFYQSESGTVQSLTLHDSASIESGSFSKYS